MLSTIGDLERIGDIYYQMSKVLERKMEQKTYFLPEQRNNILSLLDKLEDAFEVMVSNLEAEEGAVSITVAKQKEGDINTLRNKLRKEHLANVEKGEYDVKSGMAYSDLYSSCEKVGDHIINVTEALTGEV